MIADLKPYPAMKDSGVAWLGDVPEHWEVLPNRALFTEVKERDHPEEQMLSVTITKGVIRQQAFLADSSKKDSSNQDRSAYKLVRPGDIAYNKMRAWQGAVGVSGYQGIVSPAYVVQRPSGRPDSRYLHYLLRAPAFAKEAERWSYGITSDMWSLRPEHFKMIYSCLPPLPEQSAIVRLLDHADRRIRRYIRAKQKLIELLEEQKQAIIHRAVTRGLDPNVRLKPSGVESLAAVPEHWKVARLKDAADVQTGLTLGKTYHRLATESYPYLRVANVQVGRVDLRQIKRIDVPEREAAGAMLRSGDVLMTEGGDIDKLGRGCVWHEEIPGCLHQNHVFAVRCRRNLLLPEFLVGLMASQHGRAYFQLTAKQTTNLAATNSTTLRAFAIMLPPLDEQKAIIYEIERQTTGISEAVDDAEREISLLREYRTRLIADVVDRVQKGQRIGRDEHRRLKSAGLVEGRYPNLIVAGAVAKATGEAGRHIRERGFDRQYYLDLILALVREHGPVKRKDVDQALVPKLPDRLTEEQKIRKVHNLLQELRRAGRIVNRGSRARPEWVMPETALGRDPR